MRSVDCVQGKGGGSLTWRTANRFVPVMETRAWNFQEAAMTHWLPNEKDTFVVNDFRDGNSVSGDGYWDKNFYRHWKRTANASKIPSPR